MDGDGGNTPAGLDEERSGHGRVVAVMARLLTEFEHLGLDEQLVRMGTGGALLERLLALDLDEVEDAALVEAVAAANRISACAEALMGEAAGVLAERASMNPPALARAVLQVSALIDPGVLVFGGGLARSPEWTVHPAVRIARGTATFHQLPQVRLAELGVWAGAHGALLHAAEAGV